MESHNTENQDTVEIDESGFDRIKQEMQKKKSHLPSWLIQSNDALSKFENIQL